MKEEKIILDVTGTTTIETATTEISDIGFKQKTLASLGEETGEATSTEENISTLTLPEIAASSTEEFATPTGTETVATSSEISATSSESFFEELIQQEENTSTATTTDTVATTTYTATENLVKNTSLPIEKSGECGPNNVTDRPDYFAYYKTKGAGVYQMKLINLDTGHEITDSFEVRDSVPFDVERIGATRIWPWSGYGMTLKIKANEDFQGEIIETVPNSFVITDTSDKRQETKGETKEIVWNVNWKAGESYELTYAFDAPDISPYIFLLGPLKIGGFKEIRKWQIASDASNYEGPQIKTAEYSFGSSGITAVAALSAAYFVDYGTGTVSACTTTAPTLASQGMTVKLEGTNIKLRQAWVEVRGETTAAASMSDFDLALSTSPGSAATTGPAYRSMPVMGNPTTALYFVNSGEHNILYLKSEAIAAFNGITDSQWAAGVETILRVRNTGVSLNLLTAKLYLTYESDYSSTSHYEVKTVRFPLDSTSSVGAIQDAGSAQNYIAASANQNFNYNAFIPDLASNSDILDVFFELSGQVDTTTNGSIRAQVVSASPVYSPAFPTVTSLVDSLDFFAIFRPTVGTNNFLPNTDQQLKLTLGATPWRLQAAGGELVVTYRYLTSAPVQTETVRYFIRQDALTTGTTKTTSIIKPFISNTGMVARNIYVRAQSSENVTRNLSIFGQIGTGAEASNTYVLTNTNPNNGQFRIIYDMSSATSSFSSGVTTTVSTLWSGAGGDPVALELFVTFYWSGSSGGTQTKTVEYFIQSSRVGGTAVTAATTQRNHMVELGFPETVSKTLRSAYAEVAVISSDATTPVNINMGLNQDTLASAGAGYSSYIQDGEDISFYYLRDASSTVSVTSTAATYVLNMVADATVAFSPKFIVTYDVAYTEIAAPIPEPKIKTVEYSFGNSGITTIAANGTGYFVDYGTGSVSAVTTTAPTLASQGMTVKLEGTNIKLKQSWVEFRAQTATTASQPVGF